MYLLLCAFHRQICLLVIGTPIRFDWFRNNRTTLELRVILRRSVTIFTCLCPRRIRTECTGSLPLRPSVPTAPWALRLEWDGPLPDRAPRPESYRRPRNNPRNRPRRYAAESRHWACPTGASPQAAVLDP